MPRLRAAVATMAVLAAATWYTVTAADEPAGATPSILARPANSPYHYQADETDQTWRHTHPQNPYLGTAVEGDIHDPEPLEAFTQTIGRHPNMLMSFHAFGTPLPRYNIEKTAREGMLPILSWEPWDHTRPAENPYPLREIADGKWDEHIQTEAAKLAQVPATIAIRFAHEMNGNWYPWGQGVHQNTPDEYIAAHQHLVEQFNEAGAHNIIWVWSPNMVEHITPMPLAELYPGDQYVDWIGIVGYVTSEDRWYGYTKIYEETHRQLDRLAPNKPILITETAVAPQKDPEVRPHQIREMITALEADPDIVGIIWFNLDMRHKDRADWRIENDPEGGKALRDALAPTKIGVL